MVETPEANAIQKTMRDGHDICMMFAGCLFAKHVNQQVLLDADYCEHWMRRIQQATGIEYDYVVPALSGAWHTALGLGVGEAEFRCRSQRPKVHIVKYNGGPTREHARVLREVCLELLLEFDKGKLSIDKDEVLGWERKIQESLHMDSDQAAMIADIVTEIYEDAVHRCLEHLKAGRSAKPPAVESVQSSKVDIDTKLRGADPHVGTEEDTDSLDESQRNGRAGGGHDARERYIAANQQRRH